MCPCNLGLFKSFTILVPALPWQHIVDFLHRNKKPSTSTYIHFLSFQATVSPHSRHFFQQKKGGDGLAKKGLPGFGLGLDALGLTGGVDQVDSSMGACLLLDEPCGNAVMEEVYMFLPVLT